MTNHDPRNIDPNSNHADGAHPVDANEGKSKKGSPLSWPLRILIILVVVAAVLGFMFRNADVMPWNNNAQAGDCVSAEGTSPDASRKPQAVDCDGDEAKYKVLESGEDVDCYSVEGATDFYTISFKGRRTDTENLTYCLQEL